MFTAENFRKDPFSLSLILEKFVALSQRPSQYSGWEIGSTAKKIYQNPDGAGRSKRIALVWPVPYGVAMRDPRFLELYETLACMEGMAVERVMEPGEDLVAELKRSGIFFPWFSVETKSPLESFNGFIVFKGAAHGEPKEVAHGDSSTSSEVEPLDDFLKRGGRNIFEVTDSSLSGAAIARKALEAWGFEFQEGQHSSRLMAYSSGGRDEERKAGGTQSPGGALRGSVADPPSAHPAWPSQRLFSSRICLKREGWSRFLSHLEQIQVIKQAVRSAGLPVAEALSKGSKMKISFGPAVSVGWASACEFFDAGLVSYLQAEDIRERLNAALPLGYAVNHVQRIPNHFPSLEESANWAEFEITPFALPAPDWSPVLEFTAAPRDGKARTLTIRKEKPGRKVDIIDLGEVLVHSRVITGDQAGAPAKRVGAGSAESSREDSAPDGCQKLWLAMRFGPKKNLKPEKALEAVLGFSPERIKTDLLICRTRLALETQNGQLRYL